LVFAAPVNPGPAGAVGEDVGPTGTFVPVEVAPVMVDVVTPPPGREMVVTIAVVDDVEDMVPFRTVVGLPVGPREKVVVVVVPFLARAL